MASWSHFSRNERRYDALVATSHRSTVLAKQINSDGSRKRTNFSRPGRIPIIPKTIKTFHFSGRRTLAVSSNHMEKDASPHSPLAISPGSASWHCRIFSPPMELIKPKSCPRVKLRESESKLLSGSNECTDTVQEVFDKMTERQEESTLSRSSITSRFLVPHNLSLVTSHKYVAALSVILIHQVVFSN